jgi:hypothetical protein
LRPRPAQRDAVTDRAYKRASRRKRPEPTEDGAIFRRDGLFSAACATIFRRVGARRALAQ